MDSRRGFNLELNKIVDKVDSNIKSRRGPF